MNTRHEWMRQLLRLFDRERELETELANVRSEIDRAFGIERNCHVEADQ